MVFKDESSHQSYSSCCPRCDPARNPNRCGSEGTEGDKGTEGTFREGDKGTEGTFPEGDKGTKSVEGTKSPKGAEADLTK